MKNKHLLKKRMSLILVIAMIFSLSTGQSSWAYATDGSSDDSAENTRSYTVRHILQDLDGDYSIVEDEQTLTGVVGEMTEATPNSYEGFTVQDSIGNQIIGQTGDITITIKYSRNPYYITWIDGYSETNYTSRYLYGETISYPNDPSVDGHEFIGWYDSEGKLITEKTMPAEDITAIAKYNPNLDATYKVEYYVQNVTDDVDATDAEKTYSLAKSISTSVAPIDSSWNDLSSNFNSYSVNSMDFVYNESITNAANENVVVKADNSTVFKVYFDRPIITIKMQYWKDGLKANAVSIGEVKGLYGASTSNVVWPTYTHESGEPESWDGDYYWLKIANSGSIAFTGDPPTTFAQSLAYIKQNDDGTNVVTIVSYASYAKYYNSAGTGGNTDPKTQYAHFEGLDDNTWIDALTVSKKLGNYTTSIMITNGSLEGFTTAAGQWGDFTGNINDANVDFTYYWKTYGNSITLNWTDPNGTAVIPSSTTKYITHDAHIYYTRNSYTVSFSNVGNIVDDQTIKYEAKLSTIQPTSTSLTPPSYMDQECIFDGWYYDTSYTDAVNWQSDTMPAKNITLVAKWKLPEKTVKLVDSGTALGTINVTKYDSIYKTLDTDYTLSKDGYVFLGWYKDEALTKPFVYTEQITDNITLYAKWTQSNNTVYNYTVKYVDTEGNEIAEAITGKSAADTVLYFEAPAITGYRVLDTDKSKNLTVSEDNQVVTIVYQKLDRITITPQSMTAYIGGISQNGSSAPKLRYAVSLPDGVSIDDLSFDIHVVKDGKETIEHLNRSVLDSTNNYNYCLFPELGIDMGAVDENDSTVLRSHYLKLVDIDNDPTTNSGVWNLEVRSGETADWDSFYITATSGDDVYYVDIDTSSTELTIREVSDEVGMYSDPFTYVTQAINSTDDLESSNGSNSVALTSALAVIPKTAVLKTNGHSSLGILGTSDISTVTGYGDESPLIALLFDNTISLNSNISVEQLEDMMIAYAEEENGETYSEWDKDFKYLDLINVNDGNAVMTSSEAVTIYWPYPEGMTYETAKNYNWKVLHFDGMYRESAIQTTLEDLEGLSLENIEVTPTELGLKFETKTFSPFVLMWNEIADDTPNDDIIADVDDQRNPTSTDKTTVSNTSSSTNSTNDASNDSSAVKTGDNMNVTLLVSLLSVSLVAIVALLLITRRKKKSN